MAKKEKIRPVDGLGPYEKRKLRNAIRQIWHRSKARKLCTERCTDKNGFRFCEECKKRVPNESHKIDHINPVGEIDRGFIERMFVSSKGLRGLCKKCHQPKTNAENAKRRKKAKSKAKVFIGDFY